MFGLKPPPGYSTYPEFVKKWRDTMSEAYQRASETAAKKGYKRKNAVRQENQKYNLSTR